MRRNVKISIKRGMWKLMYEEECDNYYKRKDVIINGWGGM
jgi:hypothetical protein